MERRTHETVGTTPEQARRVVITGVGCISCLGPDTDTFAERLFAGDCGLSEISRLDPSGLRNSLAGEIKALPAAPTWAPEVAGADPDLRFLAAAVDEALRDSALEASHLAEAALALSTNFAGAAALERYATAPTARDFDRLGYDAGLDLLRAGLHVAGPAATLSISCASGTSVLGLAADWLRLGRAQVALVAGYDQLSLYTLAGLSILRTVSTDACRPFDRNRSGTLFAEGGAAVVLETAEHAIARGARVRAEVLGHADTNNAYHLTAPDKGGEGIRLAIERALEASGVRPEQIDYVNAHGTATLYHDATEVRALKDVLGPRAYEIPVSSIKGATGHLMGAAGTIEAIACVLAMERGQAPPTVGLVDPDPECDLDHVAGTARPCAVRYALTNSAGIGGSNASLVLRAADGTG